MSYASDRTVSVLVSYGERQLGVLGPFPVDRPRWHDVAPVTAHLAAVLGVPAVVLRLLLDHVPGADCWGPSADVLRTVVPRLARVQAALAARHPDGPPDGLPDRSPHLLPAAVRALLDGPAGAELTAPELAGARAMVDQLPLLVRRLADCGLPETVLHGDFHPGNWRAAEADAVVLLDFADGSYGHPAVDGLRPKAFTSAERWEQAAEAWCSVWRELAPGCDPVTALRLAEPLGHLGYAVRYQEFLDAIEPSEERYHAGDPAAELRAALAAFERLADFDGAARLGVPAH